MTRRVGVAVLVWAFGMLVAAFVAVSVSTALETRRLRERRRRGPRRRQATDSTSSTPLAMHSAKQAPSGIAEGSVLMARFTAAA